MQVLNFGSLNIDYVYTVAHFAAPGETLAALDYQVNAGGKGLNQSVALARAGVKTFHAGMTGKEGAFLKEILEKAGADTRFVAVGDIPAGHAVIQVERTSGENSIVLFPGANHAMTEEFMKEVLHAMPRGSWLLLQNEINGIPFLMEEGKRCGLKIAFNPAPCSEAVRSYPLHLCDLIFVNETEAAQLANAQGDIPFMGRAMAELCPESEIVITLGSKGAFYRCGSEEFFVPPCPADAVDTTGAGDTFTGYFLAAKLRNMDARQAMAYASKASALTVSRPGAASSIPSANEVF